MNGFLALGPILQISQSLAMIAMFRVVECLLKYSTGKILAQTTMKKNFPMAAFCDATFTIEHFAFAYLTPRTIRLFLPFAYPTVSPAHAYLLFVHSPDLRFHNVANHLDPKPSINKQMIKRLRKI
jgi:hypothetical protein